MRKLVYFVAVTADGFIAGPQGQFDFFPFQGDHIAAQGAELPETFPRHVRDALGITAPAARFDTVLMGRSTYEPGLRAGFPDPYAPLRSIVFSTTMPAKTEGGLRVTAEDPVDVVRALRAEPGKDLWLCGGGNLAGQLAPLIDELVLKVNPVVAQQGIRLWGGDFAPRALRLVASRVFQSGVVWLTYERG
jgi:dihydrofolate reductase